MVNMVGETYYSERNWQESALDTGIEEDTNDGMCWEASDEDTNTAAYHLTSFNKRDIRAKDGIARYTLSGSTQVEWEPEDDTQTEQSEYGKTNGITTPGSDCAEVNLSNVFTSVKDKESEYMWWFIVARVDLLTNSMSHNETAKKKHITKQISTRYTQKGNGILFGQCMIWTLLCIMPIAARPIPPRDDRMNLFSSEHMKLEDQKDMNVQGEDCRPQILAKTLPEDDFHQIECETSTCTSKSRITFEKTSMHATQEWTSVFEIYNKSNYHALNTNSEYTLKNRALFNAFPTKYLLYIQPLRLDDRGMWRCVVYDTNNISYTSITPLKVDSLYEHDTADGMFPTLCSIVFGFILSALVTTKKQCSMVKEKKKRRFKAIKKEFAMDGCLSLIFDIFQSGTFLVPYAITMILLFEPMAAASRPSRNYPQRVCNPHISANILDEVEFKQIECEISSCNKVSKITYEKKGVTNNTQWTPVFEGYNKTVFQTVDMEESNYTLTNRNDYMAFHTKHLLYIKPVILKDQGEWRCVVHDEISGDCVSNSLEVNIYVTPKEDNLNIAPSNVILLSGQSEKFDCIIDGIHPEPDVWWTTNNTEIIQGTPFNKKRMDGLWFVMNRVRVGFHETGKHALFCVVKTKTGDPWLQNSIHVDVKEDAYVSDPTDARTVSVTRNSSYTIDCHGSGYKPNITWQRNGTTILDTDSRYSMAHLCNDTFCRSSLTLKPMANLLTCASEDYIEVYTCTVALEKTFSSNHTSANINVHILNPPLINGTQMNIIAGQSCNTTLTCDVCRATSSVWKYNGTILMGEEVTHLSDGSLLLHSNMRFGQYTRTVRNAAGEVNCNVYLHNSGTTCNIQNYSTVIGVASSLILLALVLLAAIIVWKKRGTRHNQQNHPEGLQGHSNMSLMGNVNI